MFLVAGVFVIDGGAIFSLKERRKIILKVKDLFKNNGFSICELSSEKFNFLKFGFSACSKEVGFLRDKVNFLKEKIYQNFEVCFFDVSEIDYEDEESFASFNTGYK